MSCCIAANILLTPTARILYEGGKTPQVFRHWEKQGTEPFPVIWGSQPNHRHTEEKLEKDQLCAGGFVLTSTSTHYRFYEISALCELQSENAKPVQHAELIFSIRTTTE